MADVIWSGRALEELDQIVAYIDLFDPGAAERMGQELFALGESLSDFPDRGRLGPRDTRELVTVRPDILRYRLIDNTVLIIRIRHSARQPEL